jgi:WD40 repeat protein
MRDFGITITLGALHVYHSGVIDMPECALKRQATTYSIARLISERDPDWKTETMGLDGHSDWVNSVAFSLDGLNIVSGSDDCTVRVWDALSGKNVHTFEINTGSVTSVAFSPNGSRIVSASDDHNVCIWETISGVVLHTLKGHTDRVSSMAFSSDGSCIVSGSRDHTVRVWDAILGTVVYILEGHTDWVCSASFSSDGLSIVSGSHDCTVRIWDAYTGAIQHILEGYNPRNDFRHFLADSQLWNGLCTMSA